MKVPLREMPCERSLLLTNDFVRDTVATLAMRAALERPLDDPQAGEASANLSISIAEESVFVQGEMTGWVEVACSRCIGPVRIDFKDMLRVTFLPRSRVPEDNPDDDVEVTEDDEDLYPYDGEEIDLEPLVREQIVLAVPYAPLCSASCQGLCLVCGADLNTEPCNCDRRVVDPRLAALKDLKV